MVIFFLPASLNVEPLVSLFAIVQVRYSGIGDTATRAIPLDS